MKQIEAKNLQVKELYELLTNIVFPRPIALVSTLSEDGCSNLAPFSFFNVFSIHPPIIVFSPTRRSRDGSLKDTYHNLVSTKECVVHVVPYNLREHITTASFDFPKNVSEFEKAGLTPLDSIKVKPKRVQESPIHMECSLEQMVPLGKEGGAGNLAICRVLLFHIDEKLLKKGSVHSSDLQLIGRNGDSAYTKAFGEALFDLPKP